MGSPHRLEVAPYVVEKLLNHKLHGLMETYNKAHYYDERFQQGGILLTVHADDLRYDEFGAGGHPYMRTPYIDRIAHEGDRND